MNITGKYLKQNLPEEALDEIINKKLEKKMLQYKQISIFLIEEFYHDTNINNSPDILKFMIHQTKLCFIYKDCMNFKCDYCFQSCISPCEKSVIGSSPLVWSSYCEKHYPSRIAIDEDRLIKMRQDYKQKKYRKNCLQFCKSPFNVSKMCQECAIHKINEFSEEIIEIRNMWVKYIGWKTRYPQFFDEN